MQSDRQTKPETRGTFSDQRACVDSFDDPFHFKPARVPSRDLIKNSETNSEAEYIECVATECLAVYQYLLHLLWYVRHILCVGISMHTSMGHGRLLIALYLCL